MNRLDSLKEMLDFLNQDITELSEYINEENDTGDIENAKYLISDVLYKYLRILNKI